MIDPKFWYGKKVFVTGHTGFKGSWACLWLHHLGAKVTGFALPPPTEPSLFKLARIDELIHSIEGDVTQLAAVEQAMRQAEPEIVIHMAAQSLVRKSYAEPVSTLGTNIMGTANVLDAIRRVPTVRSVVMVTSDKCYHNEEWVWGYREDSRLGGDDPYSASKAGAEIVISTYQHSYFSAKNGPSVPAVASARAGNVVGGGDWAEDRLVPDILRSLLRGEPTLIRNPNATRPWQHVLEPVHGYLMLAERLYTHRHEFSSGWNFGPSESSEKPVSWIIEKLYRLWGTSMEWIRDINPGPPEKTFLKLDSSKAHAYLGWRAKLDLPTTLEWIVNWTRAYEKKSDMRGVTLAEIERYMKIKPSN
jgi:CDP-glucose 4,6-dehydratase